MSELPILIGSAGWVASTGDKNFRAPKDVDLVMYFADFEDYVTKNKSMFKRIMQYDIESYYNTAVKFLLCDNKNNEIEVEIADVLPSHYLGKGIGTTVENLKYGVGRTAELKQQVWVPPPSTLLALKVSQIFFLHNWQKTAEDLSAMLAWFGRPLDTILNQSKEIDAQAGADGPNLRSFIEERVLINAAVQYSVRGHASPAQMEFQRAGGFKSTMSSEDAKEILNRLRGEDSVLLKLLKQAHDDGDDVDELNELDDYEMAFMSRFIPFYLYESSFDDLPSLADKQRCLIELIMLVAVHYYIDSGRAKYLLESQKSSHSIAETVWRAALQSLCTNVFVELALDQSVKETVAHEHKRWFEKVKLYEKPPQQAEADELKSRLDREALYSRVAPASVIRSMNSLRANPQRVKIPTRQEVEEMRIPFRSALIKAIVNHFDALWVVPPVLVSYIETILGPKSTPEAVLPADVWQHVALNAPLDHIALLSIASTSKAINNIINHSAVSDTIWDRALSRFWTTEFVDKAVQQQGLVNAKPRDKFKAAFVVKWNRFHAKPLPCNHCGEEHAPIPEEEWLKKNGNEHTEYFCVCPDCYEHTGSWGSCEFHDVFII